MLHPRSTESEEEKNTTMTTITTPSCPEAALPPITRLLRGVNVGPRSSSVYLHLGGLTIAMTILSYHPDLARSIADFARRGGRLLLLLLLLALVPTPVDAGTHIDNGPDGRGGGSGSVRVRVRVRVTSIDTAAGFVFWDHASAETLS